MLPCTAIIPSSTSIRLLNTLYLIWCFKSEIRTSQIGSVHFVQTIRIVRKVIGIKTPVGRLLRPAVRLQSS